MTLLRAIAAREVEEASRLLAVSPGLARQVIGVGATRGDASDYYFETMSHYVYAGDSALHVAAAAYTREVAVELIAKGANRPIRGRETAAAPNRSIMPRTVCRARRPGIRTLKGPLSNISSTSAPIRIRRTRAE